MKRNMVPLLAIAFVVAIISTGIFYGLFAGKLRSSTEIPSHSIVVAARDLDRGTVLQASDMRTSEATGVLTGSFAKPQDAVGAVLMTPLKAGEPILAERVASRGPASAGGANGLVPAGMRALSIRVTESDGLMNLLRPGARVDLQAFSERDNRIQLRNVLENVEVLALTPHDANSRTPGAVVTVLTRAQDADLAALADAGGSLRLALRNPFDPGSGQHRTLDLSDVFAKQNAAAAVTRTGRGQ
jgi:Flp pilus assembly protein CpaB